MGLVKFGVYAGRFRSMSKVLHGERPDLPSIFRCDGLPPLDPIPLASDWIIPPVIKGPLMRLLMPWWIAQALVSR